MHAAAWLSAILCIYCFHFGSRMQISGVCHYKEQMPLISDPNLFLSHTALVSVPALLLLHAAQTRVKWEVTRAGLQAVINA